MIAQGVDRGSPKSEQSQIIAPRCAARENHILTLAPYDRRNLIARPLHGLLCACTVFVSAAARVSELAANVMQELLFDLGIYRGSCIAIQINRQLLRQNRSFGSQNCVRGSSIPTVWCCSDSARPESPFSSSRRLSSRRTLLHDHDDEIPEGRVAVPLDLIADKWLEYYWPLFESETFIPQMRGEKPGSLIKVKFRTSLRNLIEFSRSKLGGLGGFSVARRSNALPVRAHKLHQTAHRRVCDAILEGPVYHSGGGGSGTFAYDKLSQCVFMDADLWRELSTMGTWIADATVLRWAELTAEISKDPAMPGKVIDKLLTAPIEERQVQAARSLYEGLSSKVCVWTGSNLGERFDVDHAIPFALWRNNDLWNLLPASPSANNEKRDRLPTFDLLRARKTCIIEYWTMLRALHPVRFAFEVGRLAGPAVARGDNWENGLFGALTEAVEFTAIQRGVERWEPAKTRRARTPRRYPPESDAPEGDASFASRGEPSLIVMDPPEEERFVRFVPFYDLAAAAGAFGADQPAVDSHYHSTWIRVEMQRLTSDMFALRVDGRSMEPKIPDGSICLFRGGEALAGTRQGQIVLVALRDSIDPETGGRLTVKRYSSEKVFDEEGNYKHSLITLKPLNPEFSSLEIRQADEGTLKVRGHFILVIVVGRQP